LLLLVVGTMPVRREGERGGNWMELELCMQLQRLGGHVLV
jgi:hypothetical protein